MKNHIGGPAPAARASKVSFSAFGRGKLGLAMILVGFIALLMFAYLGYSATRVVPESPLDAVDEYAFEEGEGFVPIFASDSYSQSQAAPTLESAAPSLPNEEGAQGSPSAPEQPIYVPDRIIIPAIELDTMVTDAYLREVEERGQILKRWVAPAYGVGWTPNSATLGLPGNTVIIAHHNLYGEAFRHLSEVKVGDTVTLYSGGSQFDYKVTLTIILPEKYQPLDVRLENASWILPSEDERITLVTCWPYESNTHRVIVVAIPLAEEHK